MTTAYDEDDEGSLGMSILTDSAVVAKPKQRPSQRSSKAAAAALTSEEGDTEALLLVDAATSKPSSKAGSRNSFLGGRTLDEAAETTQQSDTSTNNDREDETEGDMLSIASDVALAPPPNPKRYAPPRITTAVLQDIEKARLLGGEPTGRTDAAPGKVLRKVPVLVPSARNNSDRAAHTTSNSYRDDIQNTNRSSILVPNKTNKEIRREKLKKTDLVDEEPNEEKNGCCGLSRCTWIIFAAILFAGFSFGFIFPYLKENQPAQQPAQRPKPQILSPDDPGLLDFINASSDSESNGNSAATYATYRPISQDENNTLSPLAGNETQSPQVLEVPSINVWKLFGNQTTFLPSLQQPVDELANGSFNESHLKQAAQLFVQSVIHKNVRKPLLRLERSTVENSLEYVVPFMDTPLGEFDGKMPYPTAPRGSSQDRFPHGDVQMLEEHLRLNGIQESDDTVQLDTTNGILYVARGNHIDVVDTNTGTVRVTMDLPRPAETKEDPVTRESWLLQEESKEQAGWQPSPPTPFIERLLLTSNFDHLVVVVSNYDTIHQARVKPLLKENFVTQLFTYHILHSGNVTQWALVNKQPHSVHGRVLYAAHAEHNQHIHVVTASAIDSARLLEDPLERLYYPDRDDNVYVDEVLRSADEKYIPLFVKRLQDEVRALEETSEYMTLFPVIQWVAGNSDSEEEQQLAHTVMAQYHWQELIVVTSLSIVSTHHSATAATRQAVDPMTSTTTRVVHTAFLGPSGVGVIGSTDTLITLTVPGYKWTEDRVLEEATHFLQWELGTISRSGSSHLAATKFQGLATIPGRLVQSSRQSTDRHGPNLRIATVVNMQWRVGATEEGETVVKESRVRESYVHVLDSHSLTPRLGSPLKLVETTLASVSFLQDMAYAFTLESQSSSLKNKASVQVIAFDQSFDNTQQSPALRLAASVEPSMQGFSPYLRSLPSMGDNKRFLMSLGENKTASGLSMGWMVSVWDATDASKLVPVFRHSLEDPNTITNWTPKSFRMTPTGLLILPMTVESVGATKSVESTSRDMTGFIVLNVSSSGVEELSRVPHIDRAMSTSNCSPGSFDCPLGSSSFWLSPVILTVGGSSVMRTTVSNVHGEGQPDWSLSLP
jgi:hypothetical protein